MCELIATEVTYQQVVYLVERSQDFYQAIFMAATQRQRQKTVRSVSAGRPELGSNP